MDETRPPASATPTLRQLQFLVALRTEGSFVAGAERVGVTQPTLSAGIKELEAMLGQVLVERGRSGAILTLAGEEAADRAERALREVEDLVRVVRGAGRPLTGRFRLGAIPTIAPYVLPRALPFLKQRFPELQLSLREDLTARLIEALRTRALDAALIALPYPAPGLDAMVIADDEFLLLCPHDHPLATSERLSLEDLSSDELLLLADGHCMREHALSHCAAAPSQRASEFGATSLQTLVQMVAGGLGVTFMPRIAADAGAAAGAAVTARAFDPPLIGRSIGVVWREGCPRAGEAQLLARVLGEHLFPNAGKRLKA